RRPFHRHAVRARGDAGGAARLVDRARSAVRASAGHRGPRRHGRVLLAPVDRGLRRRHRRAGMDRRVACALEGAARRRAMRRLGAGLLLVLASALAPALATAQTDSLAEVRRQEREQADLERQKRQELEDIRRQAAESRAAASRLRGQENKVLAQLRRAERNLAMTRRSLRALEERGRQIDRQLASNRATLDQSIQSLEEQRARFARRLRNLYKFGATGDLEFLLSTRSFGQLLARWDFLVRVAQAD